MWELEELKLHKEILDQIDFEMTPEKAVETYLEWGTSWSRKDDCARYVGQESYYFVIYAWEAPLQVTLLKHNSQGSEEITKLVAPSDLVRKCIDEGGRKPGVGVYALNEPLKSWLRNLLSL
jgi:hypothetical protein